jgi:hypothetical protein
MVGRIVFTAGLAFALSVSAGRVKGDTVQLVNGDRLHGKIVLLDEKQLVFRSASFGELKIERGKIELIALGEKRLPDAGQASMGNQPASSTRQGSLVGEIAPLLQNPAIQQQLGPMLDQLIGQGGLGDLQKNLNDAKSGLQDLKKDLGNGPDSKALDGYINLFNLLSPSPSAATPKASDRPVIQPAPGKK